jgi:thiamine kinase
MTNFELFKALSTWQSWSIPLYQKPIVIGELTAGNSHQSWRVKSGGHEFVIKCNNPSSRILSQTLEQELLCQRIAAAEGLAPEVVFDCDRFFVSRFIEAEIDALVTNWLSVGSRLKKIHSLKVQLPSFDVVAHVERYWQQINKLACSEVSLLSEVCSKMDLILPSVRCDQSELVLCHHDLNNSNVIFANTKPVFIDWEYAAPNHPYFDLATLQLRLAKDDYQQVIIGYGMGEPEMVKMNQYLCLVSYLEVLWWTIIDAKSTSLKKSFLQLQVQLDCVTR